MFCNNLFSSEPIIKDLGVSLKDETNHAKILEECESVFNNMKGLATMAVLLEEFVAMVYQARAEARLGITKK